MGFREWANAGEDGHGQDPWRAHPCMGCRCTGVSTRTVVKSCVADVSRFRDGTIVSGDSMGMVKFWDARTCTQLQSFQGHAADVLCLTVGPVGSSFIHISVQYTKVLHTGWDCGLHLRRGPESDTIHLRQDFPYFRGPLSPFFAGLWTLGTIMLPPPALSRRPRPCDLAATHPAAFVAPATLPH